MPSPVVQDYVRSAQLHLGNAFGMYMEVRERQYDDVFVELAYAASQVWGAGIALLSGIMSHDGVSNLGTSSSRHSYLRYTLDDRYLDLSLRANWPYLAMLHNFQHNLDLSQAQFVGACNQSGVLIASLNGLLPEHLRLPDEAYRWLYDVE